MPKPAAQDKELQKIDDSAQKEETLVEECEQHEKDSYNALATVRSTWDDKESMLVGKLNDTLSTGQKSQVFNPILATINFERAARVMAQPATGKAWAVSKDDLGKNMLMNLLLKHFVKNANEEFPYLLKLRFLDFYSNVYGSMFGLVPWRVNRKQGYYGPELSVINIRDVRPQPGKRSPDVSEWFGVRSDLSSSWLKAQDPNVWNMANVEAAINQAKKSGGDSNKDGQGRQNKSLVERDRYPTDTGDKTFPNIEAYTEYRGDRWITWTPRLVNNDKSRPYILRNIASPNPEGMLPIIVKHAFPLLDSMIGLGEFELGKTLQFALNSLVNLYLDGVKYSIFPPLHINLNEVTAKSIKWAPGSKWYMNHPNADVQIMNMRAGEWLSTFQSTYSFLSTAIYNLSGSTPGTQVDGAAFTEGKTPEALKQRAFKQSARDEWDRFMMENTIQALNERWIKLLTSKLDAPVVMRMFGAEIKEIEKLYPDEKILETFKSGKRGNLKIDKSLLNDKNKKGEPTQYDYEIEEGSTMAHSMVDEADAAGSVIADIVKAPVILQEIRAKGGDINVLELYKRRLIGAGMRDWDKIIIEPEDTTKAPNGAVTGGDQTGQTPEQIAAAVAAAAAGQGTPTQPPQPETQPPAPPMPPEQAQPAPTAQVPQFKDENVARIAQQVLGGVSGIPAQ